MKAVRVLGCAGLVLGGVVTGFTLGWWLQERAADEKAKASLLAAAECLRRNDIICAMTYAHVSLDNAQYAYEPRETIGDLYSSLGESAAAINMYESAIELLSTEGEKAMLVTKDVASVEQTMELLRLKKQRLASFDDESKSRQGRAEE